MARRLVASELLGSDDVRSFDDAEVDAHNEMVDSLEAGDDMTEAMLELVALASVTAQRLARALDADMDELLDDLLVDAGLLRITLESPAE